MKKSLVRSVIAVALALVVVFSFAACGKGTTEANRETNGNVAEQVGNGTTGQNSQWSFVINGKELRLPCSLAELSEAGVEVRIDGVKEEIINSTNQKFPMVYLSCGDSSKLLTAKIVTGSDADKKEANAIVYSLTNDGLVDGSVFTIKNGLALGAAVDEIVTVYGQDYDITAAESMDDLTQGQVIMRYGDDEDGMTFWFEDGKVTYIGFYIEESE